MGDLTQNAVDGLLGLLTSVITEEAKLLSGVQGNIQFIKDEMDSMNGFLLHLTKTDTEHNDQHRAWMKQVREIAYIAQDCIKAYTRDLTQPGGTGLWAFVQHLPTRVRTMRRRHRLAKKIRELKERVREVGERRMRYGVSIPDGRPKKPEPIPEDSKAYEKREEFLRALEEEEEYGARSPHFKKAMNLLPGDLLSEAGKEIREILKKCGPGHIGSMKMLLCALYAYPSVTKEEMTNLKKKLMEGRAADMDKEVMLFSYSKLSTHYKSCLQYLTSFLEEKSISRTSLVRRWVAECLVVARDEGLETLEEAAERCFNGLVFRGFVRPTPPIRPGLKIKSCIMEKSIRDFIVGMAQSENFVSAELPRHLHYQREIRKLAQQSTTTRAATTEATPCPWNICPRKQLLDDNDMATYDKLHPMDKLVRTLKSLPEEYRLNVLDLGGCRGLKIHHLKSICKVVSLKYLSLRNTEVSHLPKEINHLHELETLDVRQTPIPAVTTKFIDILKLKHLLAGNIQSYPTTEETESFSAVHVPCRMGASMEILRHVHISHGKEELDDIGQLRRLRKLGVVLDSNEDNISLLLRTITRLSECLRSLSVYITRPPSNAKVAGIITLEDNAAGAATSILSSPPKHLESLNIKYFRGSRTTGSLPSWIRGLNRLSKITLQDTQLAQGSMRTLGNLEGLGCLRLRCGSYADELINFKKGEFLKLRFLQIDQVTAIVRLSFQKDAAPKLEKIVWTVDKEMEVKEDTISGINNLASLEELELNGSWNDEGNYLKQNLVAHPKHPRLMSQGMVIRYSDDSLAYNFWDQLSSKLGRT